MAGKRNWFVLRKYMLQAASAAATKGNSLVDRLVIPESFSLEPTAEIDQRRTAAFNALRIKEKFGRKPMILIAEIKKVLPARLGKRPIVEHMPDSFFMTGDHAPHFLG